MNKEDIIIPEDFRYEPPVISEFAYSGMALVRGTSTETEGPGYFDDERSEF